MSEIFEFDKEDNLNNKDDEEDIDLSQFNLNLKKKKKKKKISENNNEVEEKIDQVIMNQEYHEYQEYQENQEYDYVFLLDRLFTQLRDKNPHLVLRKKQVIPPPILHKVGKKTMWSNFLSVVSVLKRSTEHVQSFINYEMSTDSSIDGNKRLLIKGKFNSKNLEKVLTNYIIQYVSCYICKSSETLLFKDPVTRICFIKCDICKSTKSVNPIKKSCRI